MLWDLCAQSACYDVMESRIPSEYAKSHTRQHQKELELICPTSIFKENSNDLLSLGNKVTVGKK